MFDKCLCVNWIYSYCDKTIVLCHLHFIVNMNVLPNAMLFYHEILLCVYGANEFTFITFV